MPKNIVMKGKTCEFWNNEF